MQFTADIAETELAIPSASDCSALGAAFMGLLGLGVHSSLDSIAGIQTQDEVYHPSMPADEVHVRLDGRRRAVGAVLSGIAEKQERST